ncbi:MAG: anthranilate synthase component I [SAR324 cluster bacterium]|nr:anthranilate synthase component I [SAR324 cluster bacterium]MBL7035111.1 anthranilate synthase component I [SAR324 cluster bacterium]
MNNSIFTTDGGVKIEKSITPLDSSHALDKIYQYIDTHKGALFVSNYEVPDRYSRWDLGFVHPALELIARKRQFEINALNPNGTRLLKLIAPALEKHPHLESFVFEATADLPAEKISGSVKPMPDFFPEEERSRQPSLFSVIRKIFELFRSTDPYLGLYGAFGYDLVFQFENIEAKHQRDPEQIDCHLFLPVELVVVDRQKEEAYKIEYHIETLDGMTESWWNTGTEFPVTAGKADGIIKCDHKAGEFEQKVKKIQEGCSRGDFFEVVLSQAFSTGFADRPANLFKRICQQNPSPYSFLINMGKEQLVGASPEMYVRVKEERFETSPISGTVAVGGDPMETAERIKALISSEKEESELTMCTDVDRNDMARICEPGSVRLIGRRLLERYSRLIHTVDHLEGILNKDRDALDAVLTHMWACTVTGSPKPIAMQTIENMEKSPRGWYSGCIGFLWFNGYVSTGMTLRTVHLKNGQATVRAGATLLYDSDPAAEERETHIKASAFLGATLGSKPPTSVDFDLPQTGEAKTVLFVDNQDSFVHTLAGYVRQTGAKVITLRSGFPYKMLDEIAPDLLFISPGPGFPSEQNVPELVGEALARKIPVFGVCLGHQGIAEHFGAKLLILEHPVHGKSARISHNDESFYSGLQNPFSAGRYHSLYVDSNSLPDCLEITAKSEEGLIMGLQHRTLPVASVQFHPESILTLKDQTGLRMINKVLSELLESEL